MRTHRLGNAIELHSRYRCRAQQPPSRLVIGFSFMFQAGGFSPLKKTDRKVMFISLVDPRYLLSRTVKSCCQQREFFLLKSSTTILHERSHGRYAVRLRKSLGKMTLNSSFPIPGYDIPAITALANDTANTLRPIVIPASKSLRNLGGVVNMSSKQYLNAAMKARLKTIGGVVTLALADLALGQALYNEYQAFKRGECRAIGD